MLLLLSVVALLVMALLDVIRSRLLAAAGVALEGMLGPTVLAGMLRRGAAATGAGDACTALRDVNALRGLPRRPRDHGACSTRRGCRLYVVIIFLFHPLLGVVALGGAVVMLALAVLNEALSRAAAGGDAARVAPHRPLRRAEHGQRRSRARAGHGRGPDAGWEQAEPRAVLEKQIEASRRPRQRVHGPYALRAPVDAGRDARRGRVARDRAGRDARA